MPLPVENLIIAAAALLQWVGPILLTIVLARVGIWLAVRWEEFKVSQPEHIQDLIDTAVELAVDFAEKIDLEGMLEEYADTKKEAAKQFARDWLALHGIANTTVLDPVIDGLIEVILYRRDNQE